MAKKQADKKNPKRALNTVDRRYLRAVDILVETGKAKSHSDICVTIGIDRSIISKMRNEKRSVTMSQLEATITTYKLNSEYFFYDDRDLFPSPVKEAPKGIQTSGDNNKIFNVEQGDIHGNILYEQIADQIINEAPPEFQNKIQALLNETNHIKKMAIAYEKETKELKTDKRTIEKKLEKTNEELHATKDELINLLRNFKP